MGQDDGASEFFVVQEATSSKSIESSSTGSIIDHGIQPSSTLYVLWLPNQHVQVNVYCIVFPVSNEKDCFVLCKLMYCACVSSGNSLRSTK